MTVPEIDVDELRTHHEAGAPIIDVRQPDEYDEAHVPGAQLIPLGEVPERMDELPDARPLYLICRSGARSGKAGEFLGRPGLRRRQRGRRHPGLDRRGVPGRHGWCELTTR